MTAQKYLKKWLGVPTRGCTNLSIFHPYLLSIKPVSQIYLQGHVGNYINSTMKADPDVKLAIESSIYRESQWTRKSSTVVKCKDIMEKLAETEHVPTVDNCPNVVCSTMAEVPKLKKAASAAIADSYLDYWNDVAKDLIMQGDFLRLLAEEESHMTWQSFKYSLPKGVLGWAARAATNSLATPDNLFDGGIPEERRLLV